MVIPMNGNIKKGSGWKDLQNQDEYPDGINYRRFAFLEKNLPFYNRFSMAEEKN